MTNTVTICKECGFKYRKVREISRNDPCEFCGSTEETAIYDLNSPTDTIARRVFRDALEVYISRAITPDDTSK
jgi:C4-type Zn-finger protein